MNKVRQSQNCQAGTNAPRLRSQISPKPPAARSVSQSGWTLSWPVIVCLSLIGLSLIVYAPVRHYGFVGYDDPAYVWDNPHVYRGLSWHSVSWAFTHGYASNWHPLAWISHMIDVQLYGLNGGPHHITNLALHIATALLLFGFLYRATSALGRSAAVAALFAVHPLHVESVAWVAERKDVLSAFFWMLALCAYLAYAKKQSAPRYLTVFGIFVLALMAKPMTVTLPFVLLLMDVWPLRRVALDELPVSKERRRAWFKVLIEKIPLLVLSGASSVVTFFVQRHWGSVWRSDTLPFTHRLANALVSYVGYIGKMIWPSRLAPFYPYRLSIPPGWVIASALVLAAISIGVLWQSRRSPYLGAGWLWYLGTLVPAVGLVQVGWQSMADRYTYIPSIGLFVIAAWGLPDLLARWPHHKPALAWTAAAAILALTIAARLQVRYWKTDIDLWVHALQVTNGNYVAHNNLGVDYNNDRRFDEAIPHYFEAMRLKPDYPDPHNNYGLTLANEGKLDEAIAQYREALRLNPGYSDAHNNLGAALANQGKYGEAIPHYEAAIRGNPDYAAAHNNLGLALTNLGRIDEAIGHYQAALEIQPKYAEAQINLGDALTRAGKFEQAAAHYAAALRLHPNAPEIHRSLGAALAQQGKVNDAIFEYLRALQTTPNQPDTLRELTELVKQRNAPAPMLTDPAKK